MPITRPVKLVNDGPKPASGSLSVTFASDSSALPVAMSGSGVKTMNNSVSIALASDHPSIPVSLGGGGQKATANSTSVTLSSDHASVPVTLNATGTAVRANSQSITLASDHPSLGVTIATTGAQPTASSLSVTLATDQAAVALAEPGTGLVTGSITTATQRLAAALSKFNGACIYLSGTYAGVNVSFEASYDGGTNYIAVNAVSVSGNTVVTTTGALTNTNTAYEVYCPGATHISVRSTAWTSGSMSVRIAPYVVAMDPNPVVTGVLNANQSTNAAQWGGTSVLNGGSAGSVGVGGLAADSAAAAGSPVQTGGKVRTAVDTTLAASDAMALTGTSGMQLLVKPYGLPETDWQFTGLITTATASAAKAAGAAGVRNYVTAVQYQNTSATASEIQVQDGSTAIWRGQAPASMAQPAIVVLPTPLRGTAATALNVQLITTGSNTFVNLQGYQAV